MGLNRYSWKYLHRCYEELVSIATLFITNPIILSSMNFYVGVQGGSGFGAHGLGLRGFGPGADV